MSWAGWLSFALYVGAAVYEADTTQAQALQDRVRPQLEGLKEDGAAAGRILETVHDIMGADWRPPEDWERQIQKLLRKENHAQGLG